MNVIDIVLGGLIIFGLIRGLFKGLFVEIASLLALVLGIYGAIHFSFYVAEFLISRTEWNEKTINIVAFVITFIIIVVVIGLAGKALTKIADFAALGLLNKLLGGLFGGLKIALILSIVLHIFDSLNRTLPFVEETTIHESCLYKPIKDLAPMLFPYVIKADVDLEEDTEEQP